MTDINQWRRMIQPSRARTPVVDADDSDGVLSPPTQRKPLKPKLSSYFTQITNAAAHSRTDLQFDADYLNPEPQSWLRSTPNPSIDSLIESIMWRLLDQPYAGLEPRFNGSLLRIFEGFRSLNDDKQRVERDILQEVERRDALKRAMCQSAQQWDREKQEYKAEVKRLELILAKGERGLAEVTLARQDSALRRGRQERDTSNDHTLETIFQLLERSRRYEERLRDQRASMRKKPTSPSAGMKRLSTVLMNGESVINLQTNIPFETPLDASVIIQRKASNSETNTIRRQPSQRCLVATLPDSYVRPTEPKVSYSDGSRSGFSCEGDLLPDESSVLNFMEATSDDTDLVAMTRIAQILARRRRIDPSVVMEKLVMLFNDTSAEMGRSGSLTKIRDISSQPRSASATHEGNVAGTSLRKQPTLKSMASSFFSRWKPQRHIYTSVTGDRRFSFEPGDDTDANMAAPGVDFIPTIGKERVLRKSRSTSFLTEIVSPQPAHLERPLSPLAQSPTTTAPRSESRRPSRIPTPVYSSTSLARPRSERENSTSSLLTAIRHEGDASQRSDSPQSSTHSSSIVIRNAPTWPAEGSDLSPSLVATTMSSNSLLEHTNLLRGNAFAAAAARAASTATLNADQDKSTKRSRMPSRSGDRPSQSRTIRHPPMPLDVTRLQNENEHPMGGTTDSHPPASDAARRLGQGCE